MPTLRHSYRSTRSREYMAVQVTSVEGVAEAAEIARYLRIRRQKRHFRGRRHWALVPLPILCA